jgi:hypothetical protein
MPKPTAPNILKPGYSISYSTKKNETATKVENNAAGVLIEVAEPCFGVLSTVWFACSSTNFKQDS